MAENKSKRVIVFMSRHMIACDKAGYLISKSKDSRLSLRELAELKIHMMSCHLCRKYEKQINHLNKLVGVYREQCAKENCTHSLSEDCRQTISLAVQKELNSNL